VASVFWSLRARHPQVRVVVLLAGMYEQVGKYHEIGRQTGRGVNVYYQHYMFHYYKTQRNNALNNNIEIFPNYMGRNTIVSSFLAPLSKGKVIHVLS
jgi:hypothetical protein